MCILLLLERVYWLLFILYLIVCKIGVVYPHTYAHSSINNIIFYF